MTSDKMLVPEFRWRHAQQLAWNAAIIGGCVAYYLSWQRAFPPQPPLPPGTGSCGMGALLAPFVLLIGPPLGTITSAVVGGILGGILDYILYHRRQNELNHTVSANATPPHVP